ncbi:fumarylacetoacetate hydrolase family protein [Streptomyces sp. DSM 44917]|uniref:Fumarylacetoacetate hydrolase family protein n=1 Tax=Streptomyces boetiae TaxID=3075541 RepID=A0ABU2LDP8_9ACTN|nr:fumarylacetoacetate hydrolase family protein [Streptomyces sp. DSM 44917]MDT0309700.1 fumarylacetoacetate hydrolase family protein [Streptomyces sp. DSM 44917]
MRFLRFSDGVASRVGVLAEGGEVVRVVEGAGDLLPLIQAGEGELRAAGEAALRGGAAVEAAGVTPLAPVGTPPTVRDFYAFEQHVAAGRASRGQAVHPDWYELPVFYFSSPYAVTGCGEVPMTPGTAAFDFELEVAAIVGRGGRDLTPEEGEAAVLGYCVMNDFSGRDVQRREMRQGMGPVKGKDTATALGPWLVTKDELAGHREGTGYRLAMTCEVNGVRYSEDLWSRVYWSFGEMIAYASRGAEVRPGDVIGSGTCGTGCILELSATHGPERYPWLKPGDEVVAAIEGLGALRNTVTEGVPPVPLRP